MLNNFHVFNVIRKVAISIIASLNWPHKQLKTILVSESIEECYGFFSAEQI